MTEFRNDIFGIIGMVMFLDSYSKDELVYFLGRIEADIEDITTTIEEYLKMIDALYDDVEVVREKVKDLFSNLRYNLFIRENILCRL